MFHMLILTFTLLPIVLAQTSSLTNVTQAFSQAKIVPDVLSSFAPTALANITFSNTTGSQSLNVTPGALLTEPQTAVEPKFSLISNSTSLVANQTFVLALVDPDAPSPQNRSASQFLHFLGGGFTVNATSSDPTLLTNQSAALREFFPPTPPAGSPPHRYVLVVYPQPSTFEDDSRALVNASTPRNNFNLTTFASTVKLGSPFAGNFFFVGPDNSTSTSTTGSAAPTATAPPSTTGASGPSTSGGSTGGSGTPNGASVDVQSLIGVKGYTILALLWYFL